jgi:hypothetical protein
VLESQVEDLRAYARGVTPERETFAYEAGKWSIREVVGHIVDGERVFGYRVFCISRGEKAALPTFDENEYAAQSPAASTPLVGLVSELATVRQSNLLVLRRLTDAAWHHVGTASGASVSVRAMAYIMAGHLRHHLNVLNTRYQ